MHSLRAMADKYAGKAQETAKQYGINVPASIIPGESQQQQQQPQPLPHTNTTASVNATTNTNTNTGTNQNQNQNQGQNPPKEEGMRASAGSNIAALLNKHGLGEVQNKLRTYQISRGTGPDRQIQLAITAQKSVALEFEGAGRDAQIYSKELYLWGQEQTEDIKDVTDRLAYLNFVHGQINTDLSKELEAARGPWKTARATESTAGTLKASGRETRDVANEAAVEQRNALKDGEAARWRAIREYAEKLILLSQAAEVIVDECLPPANSTAPYSPQAKQRTAEIRSTLQRSLDNWHLNPTIAATSPFVPPSGYQGSPDGRSFGETHRQELDRTPSVIDKQKADQEALDAFASSSQRPAGPAPTPASGSGTNSTGVNPAQLNNAPAPVPSTHAATVASPTTSSGPLGGAGSPTIPSTAPLNLAGKKPNSGSGTGAALVGAGVASGLAATGAASTPPSASTPTASNVASHPTVAETGMPIASTGGPGPSSGSLLSSASPASAGAESATWTGPLQGGPGGFRDPRDVGPQGTSQAVKYETAEEEKKRLEREDRERLLRFGTGANTNTGPSSAYAPAPSYAGPSATTGTGLGPGPVPPSQHETAEEEKKRLEREEREKLLRGQGGNGGGAGPSGGPGQDDGNDLPAYKAY